MGQETEEGSEDLPQEKIWMSDWTNFLLLEYFSNRAGFS